MCSILVWSDTTANRIRAYLAEEPCNQVAEDDGLVSLVVARRGRDTGSVPEIGLPLVEVTICRLGINEENAGSALDKPAPIQHADSSFLHRFHTRFDAGIGGLELFYLDSSLFAHSKR